MQEIEASMSNFYNQLSHPVLWKWIIAFGLGILITIIFRYAARYFSKRLTIFTNKTENRWDNLLPLFLNKISFWFIFSWVFLSLLSALQIEGKGLIFIRGLTIVLTCWQLGRWGFVVIREWHERFLLERVKKDASSAAALELFYTGTKSLFVIALILIALSNLGVNVGALLTGLGIGGIAVALAAQNILGDLLSSLSIALDKPFVVGDYIVTDSDQGTVEHIGVKTTRVRSISGEELIFSNKDLLESRLRNYKRMWRRRVSHEFAVPYETETQKLNQIPAWIKEITSNLEKMSFDRCHLSSYKNSFLNFELVFWIEGTDYNMYMDLQQKLFIKLTEKLKSEGISLAYSTQMLHILSVSEASKGKVAVATPVANAFNHP